jgi:2-keto-4-pentenoate hydratase/2-oxohepta-3-ene-1,7-dioic acid hydratase in catechol pathway
MRWITYTSPDGTDHAGFVRDAEVHGYTATSSLLDLLNAPGGLPAAGDPDETHPLDAVRLRAPIPRPPSVRDFLSFEEHCRNASRALGRDIVPVWYRQPVFYFSNPAAILGPTDDVPISPGSVAFDYEVEVAAVVGRAGSNLTAAEAEDHIAGYTVLCDWSARDLQGAEMPAGLGPAKGKDGATSLGPVLVTPDELEPYRSGKGYDLAMRASRNGDHEGGGTWADVHWSFGEMLAYASRGTELRPGDVIGSGTVGTGCLLELSALHGTDSYPYLSAGDTVTIEVERVGAITARIRPAPDLVPFETPDRP